MLSQPQHPAKAWREPGAGGPGAAVRMTVEPSLNSAVQVAPHSIPVGELVTSPEPGPVLCTSRVCWGIASNSASTDLAALIVTSHFPSALMLSQPLHAAKVDLALWVAVRMTVEPSPNGASQVAPHSIPAGALVTSPEPEPTSFTLRVCWGPTEAKSAVIVTASNLLTK